MSSLPSLRRKAETTRRVTSRREGKNQSVSCLSVVHVNTNTVDGKASNEKQQNEDEEKKTTKTEHGEATFLTHLVAGFCGGALSRTVTSPLNVVQVRKMTNQLTGSSKLVPSLVKIARTEGVKTLFA